MTQKDLSAKIPSPITFHVRGKTGEGTLTYAAREEQYIIVETGKPEQPIYLKQEDLPHITEVAGGMRIDLPEETGAPAGAEKNVRTS